MRTMRPCYRPNWFDSRGARIKAAQLQKRLPNVRGNLFLTLTLDPSLFDDSESAFDYSRGKIRKLFYRLKKGVIWKGKLYKISAPRFVKLEFHENGWPHYHIVYRTNRFLPGQLLNKLWGLGRCNVKRINNKKFHYLLKYISKDGSFPDWVLNRQNLRVIQSSPGFYDSGKDQKRPAGKKPEPKAKKLRRTTIGERLEANAKLALVQEADGSIRTAKLPVPYFEFLNNHIHEIALAGHYLGNGEVILTQTTIMIWKRILKKSNLESSSTEWLYPALQRRLNARTGQGALSWSRTRSASAQDSQSGSSSMTNTTSRFRSPRTRLPSTQNWRN